MMYALLIGLLLPLAGFLVLTAVHPWICRRSTGLVACGTVFLSFLSFVYLLINYTEPVTYTFFPWIPVEGIQADFALKLNPIVLTMTLVITGVGFLIHVYSNGYMEYDDSYVRYFAFLNLFIFAMLLLVLAANLALLFVGWEGVGLASYLLIGFWFKKPSAAEAAVKAFVVNRIGDFGLLVGLLLTFHLFGTSDIATINEKAVAGFAVGAPIITLLTALYFIGSTGKSAQLPLYSWLPDAMEGPTPVSALIHAATMVTAGVFLVVQFHPLYRLAPETSLWIGIIGGATALFAACCALAQTDLKRVLAFSTVSQLGYMFLACGAGAYFAAMFHLVTHAFMKGLLFLTAGNVVHSLHDTTDMGKMGGLKNILPKSRRLFLIGALALSGIPPLAGFFSKDLILDEVHAANFNILFYIGLFASFLTAFYMIRAYILTFHGKPNLTETELKSVHEAPQIMWLPESVLAVLSIVGGAVAWKLAPFLQKAGIETPHLDYLSPATVAAAAIAIFGLALAVYLYAFYKGSLGQPIQILKRAFYVDEIYDTLIVTPLKLLSKAIAHILEPLLFEESITKTATLAAQTAKGLQTMQSGQIRSSVAWLVIGCSLAIAYLVRGL